VPTRQLYLWKAKLPGGNALPHCHFSPNIISQNASVRESHNRHKQDRPLKRCSRKNEIKPEKESLVNLRRRALSEIPGKQEHVFHRRVISQCATV